MYSLREFVEGAEAIVRLLNDLRRGLPACEPAPLEEPFLTSSRYEFLFSEMSWNHAEWPI